MRSLVFGIVAIIAAAATLAIASIAMTSNSVSAINDKFTTDCSGPGASGHEGECNGGSQNSGPHDETTTNPGGNVPPGQQEEERDD